MMIGTLDDYVRWTREASRYARHVTVTVDQTRQLIRIRPRWWLGLPVPDYERHRIAKYVRERAPVGVLVEVVR